MPSPRETRDQVFARYRAQCRAASANSALREIDEWRMPNSADAFDLTAFANYLEESGEAIALLTCGPLNPA